MMEAPPINEAFDNEHAPIFHGVSPSHPGEVHVSFIVYVPLQFAFGAVQLVSYRTKPACRRCFSFSLRCTFTYRFGRVMCLYTLYKTYNI